MARWSNAAGIIFLAVSSVYAGEATPATQAVAEVLDAGAAVPATQPSSSHSETSLVNDTSPASESNSHNEGQSLTKSQVNITDAGTVEIHVNEANIVEVLRMMSLQSQRNIIASKEVKGTLTANLYDVTVPEALDAILHANGYAYREKGNFIYVYSAKELVEIEKSERQARTEVFRLFYTPAANVVPMIKPVLSGNGQVSFTTAALSGLDTGTKDLGGNNHATEDMIVVTDYAENIDQVKKIIAEVDHRPQQILVEATILSASLTENNALGVDFQVLGGVDFSGAGGIGNVIGGTVDPKLADKSAGGAQTGFTQNVPSGGLRVGVVTNNLAVFLSALEAVTNTTVLANPKVLALNKQKGEVIVGRKDGYLTTTVTESSSVQTIEFLETGTRMVFRPYIGDDGYIRMEIHPEDSTGGLTAANLPFKVTTEVTSNIMVKDGHTIVIGGLFRESSTMSRSQIPGLGNLPGLGYLFRNQNDATAREEIIILLTPHIIKDDSSYSKESLQALKDGEQLRIGVRKGMMFFGRERLAESCYDSAVAEMAKPNPDRSKVMWHLNSAINLNPQFLEAIKLKEEITGQELRSVDNSTIHGFVTRRIVAERDLTVHTPPAATEIAPPPHSSAEGPTTRPLAAMVRPVTRKVPEQHTESVVELPNAENTSDKAASTEPTVTELSTGEIAPK